MIDTAAVVLQEQLKQEVAALQKQLTSQKKDFEEEAKARERLQEEHEKELRHLKRDIKHKQVGCKHVVLVQCNSSHSDLIYDVIATMQCNTTVAMPRRALLRSRSV